MTDSGKNWKCPSLDKNFKTIISSKNIKKFNFIFAKFHRSNDNYLKLYHQSKESRTIWWKEKGLTSQIIFAQQMLGDTEARASNKMHTQIFISSGCWMEWNYFHKKFPAREWKICALRRHTSSKKLSHVMLCYDKQKNVEWNFCDGEKLWKREEKC